MVWSLSPNLSAQNLDSARRYLLELCLVTLDRRGWMPRGCTAENVYRELRTLKLGSLFSSVGGFVGLSVSEVSMSPVLAPGFERRRPGGTVSQQIRRLEEQLGRRMFRKEGRGLVPTEAGDVILSYARRILDLNDEAVAAARGIAVGGSVRFGLQTDLTENWLPKALARAKNAHPEIQVEISADRYAVLIDRLDKGQLDLALLFGPTRRVDGQRITSLPMAWMDPGNNKSCRSVAGQCRWHFVVHLVISVKQPLMLSMKRGFGG
jgi:LysR substrate binding domain-containing protein/regulatory helix-turn-helix LysR family protein